MSCLPALLVFECFAKKVAFHLNTFLQRLLAFSKVTQVSVSKLPLFPPQVTIAQSYACEKYIYMLINKANRLCTGIDGCSFRVTCIVLVLSLPYFCYVWCIPVVRDEV